jgi:IS5 family transposase
VVAAQGLPLGATHTAASEHDRVPVEGLIAALPPIAPPAGYRRTRPDKVQADKGYDVPRCRAFLRRRGSTPRMARRGGASSEKRGRHRWVVDRTQAWLHRFRRLPIRYERREDIHAAFLTLACALICFTARTDGVCSAL